MPDEPDENSPVPDAMDVEAFRANAHRLVLSLIHI